MRNIILTILWLSWVAFCSLAAWLFKLIPIPVSFGTFQLEDTVCATLHSKGLLSDAQIEFEREQEAKLSGKVKFGYWTLIAPILPILKQSGVIDSTVTFFTRRWISDSMSGNRAQRIVVKNTEAIGELSGKLLWLFGWFPHTLLLTVAAVYFGGVRPAFLAALLYFVVLVEMVLTFRSDCETIR